MQKLSSTLRKILENIERKHVLPCLDSSATAQFAVAEYIARSDNAEELIGTSRQETQKIFEWVESAMKCHEKQNNLDTQIKNIDSALLTSTYLTSTYQLTLADIFVFSSVSKYMHSHIHQLMEFPNAFRWFDLMQHAIPGVRTLDIHTPLLAMAAENHPVISSSSPPKSSMTPPKKKSKEPDAVAQEAKEDASVKPSNDKKAVVPRKGEGHEEEPPSKADTDLLECASQLDLRVGYIQSVEPHPNADALYLEKIDVGESEPRVVLSGLAHKIPMDQLQHRACVVVCNLKPVNMRGITSHAMLLCVSNDDAIALLEPSASEPPGTSVSFEGVPRTPVDQLKPKKKVFEKVAEKFECQHYLAGLATTTSGFLKLVTPQGQVKNTLLAEGHVR